MASVDTKALSKLGKIIRLLVIRNEDSDYTKLICFKDMFLSMHLCQLFVRSFLICHKVKDLLKDLLCKIK